MGTKKPGYRSSRAAAFGADNGARTRDPNLGKVVLYQLSHVRICKTKRAPERPDVAWRRSGFEPGVKALQASALPLGHFAEKGPPKRSGNAMERTTGLEPATPTLARLCSTN